MRISIIDIDSKIPNLALYKIAKYHSDLGDDVKWNLPLFDADKTYVSCVFSWNRDKCKQYESMPNVQIGGSGYDLKINLPEEIESVKPKINLGYTTRGCPRKCEFCIVPIKEKMQIVGDIYDLWDGKVKEIRLLDDNILAFKDHFQKICQQLRELKLKVNFDGLDMRLLNDYNCTELASLRHCEYRFALDHPILIPEAKEKIALLKKYGLNQNTWYVLVGYNTTIEQDLFRINLLKEWGQVAFVQKYNYTRDKRLIQLARWANQHHLFKKMTFEQFLEKNRR